MVVFVLALHPIANIFIGVGTAGFSFFASFEITTRCLRDHDSHSRDYQSITIDNKIIIDDGEGNKGEDAITFKNTVRFKKRKRKVYFNKVVGYRPIPNKDESPKGELWYNSDDYLEFKKKEAIRGREQYNLQKIMAQVEEDKHIHRLLEEMQQKELLTDFEY